MTFHDVPDEAWEIGSCHVLAQPISHPGPTVGYRLNDGGGSLAYLPDHEPAFGVDRSTVPLEWMSGYALAEGVDVLLHDSQYGEGEFYDCARQGVGRRRERVVWRFFRRLNRGRHRCNRRPWAGWFLRFGRSRRKEFR